MNPIPPKGGDKVSPMTEGEIAIFSRLADASAQQAAIAERLVGVLGRIGDHLERSDNDRDEGMQSLRKHISDSVSDGISRSDTWFKRALWAAIGLIALSNLLGVALSRYIAALPH